MSASSFLEEPDLEQIAKELTHQNTSQWQTQEQSAEGQAKIVEVRNQGDRMTRYFCEQDDAQEAERLEAEANQIRDQAKQEVTVVAAKTRQDQETRKRQWEDIVKCQQTTHLDFTWCSELLRSRQDQM